MDEMEKTKEIKKDPKAKFELLPVK